MFVIVPARAGSKRIPKKNLALFCGKPLIAHTFDLISRLRSPIVPIVFTDDEEVKELGVTYGLDVGYQRPSSVSTDSTAMAETLTHLLNQATAKRPWVKTFALLQPTSPLRTAKQVDNAISLFNSGGNFSSLVSINPMIENPKDCLSFVGKKWTPVIKPEEDALFGVASDERRFYFINGAIYISNISDFNEHRTFLVQDKTIFFEMPWINSIDIDEPWQLEVAQNLFLDKQDEI